ncbi:hypothetical protein WAJ29_22200, partial [Acinetobacter baumannii]
VAATMSHGRCGRERARSPRRRPGRASGGASRTHEYPAETHCRACPRPSTRSMLDRRYVHYDPAPLHALSQHCST